MFYFQQLFNTAMSGIDSGGATAGAVQVAQYILLASLLFGVYEAWARGGDTHFLGATAVRFFAVGLVMINYGSAFRDVNGMFNNVANFINTSTAGGGDVFGEWMSDLSNYWNNNNGIQPLWGPNHRRVLRSARIALASSRIHPFPHHVRAVLTVLHALRLDPVSSSFWCVNRVRCISQKRSCAAAASALSAAIPVDNEKGAFAEAVLGAINAVTASHSPLGLKIGQQGEPQLAIVRKRQMTPGVVDGNAKQLRIQTVKPRQQFVVQRGLIATHRTPVSWVENENYGSAADTS
jgi:hypothetical protein